VSPDNSQDIVTAVIVAHDGAAWIASVAHAVASQSRPVQRVVAVDTGSRDRSGAMLTQAFGRGAVFGMERAAGYGAAVSHALRHRAANAQVPQASPGASEERTEWVWLIHDDCEPAPDALEQLLLGAKRAPASAVLGPKVKDWSDRDVLLEAGITIDRAGRRVTGIEPREVDQGQHDGDRDVVAVSTAGMLIRRDVWDEVGGFDPGMRLFREDVDFCWRVQAAGYRVRLITDAVVYHVEASARNRRPTSAAPRRRREDRRNGLTTLLGNLPAGPMLSSVAGNLMLSTLRTLFFLLAKRPAAALDEVAAYCSVTCQPLRLSRARRHRSRGRQTAYTRLRTELPPSRSLRKLAEFVTNALSKSLPVDTVGSHHATEDPSDDDYLLTDSGLVQRLLTNPGVLLFLGLTVVALVAERSLLASTPLGGGALVPAWGGASGLWQEYFQGFHPAGIGTDASTPPYVAVLAVLATILGGKSWLAVDVILLGCVPLAGITAFLAAGKVTRFAPARVWAALTYALLPVGMGAVASGRLGTALVLVLAPLAVVLAARSFTGTKRRARRAAWATALVVAVAAAFVPLVWLIAAAAMLVGAVVFQRRRGVGAVNAAIVIAVPLLLLMPWTVSLLRRPAQFFLEAGMTRPGLSSPHLAARSLLLLSPGGPGLPGFWVTGGLALAAAIALVASGRRALVLAGWGVAVIGLVAAAVVSRVAVIPPDAPAAIPAWPGAALAIAGAGLLLASVAAADRIPALLGGGGWRTGRGLAVLAVVVVACSAPVLAAAHWVVTGVNGPVAPAAGPLLPEFVSVSSDGASRVRTLVLQAGARGSVTYTVLRSSDPLIGTGELTMPVAGQRALDHTVAALTAPNGGDVEDQGQALAGFGIEYVMLPAPVNANLARLLDDVPGLRPVSETTAFQLWRVVNTTARVTLTQPDGTVVALPSGTVSVSGAKAPSAGGTLVLAEPAGGWHATLNGRPLTPLKTPVNGWAQGFQLPAGGGSLSIGRSDLSRTVAVSAEVLAVLIVIGLGLPGARDAEESPEEGAGARGQGRRAAGHGRGGDRARDRRAGRRGRAEPADLPEPAEEEPAVVGAAAAAAAGVAAPDAPLRGSRSGAEAAAPARPTRRPPIPSPSQARSRLRAAVPSGVRGGLLRRGGAVEDDDVRDDGDHYGDARYGPGRYGRPGGEPSDREPSEREHGEREHSDGEHGDEGRYDRRGRREYQGARRADPDDATAYLPGDRGTGPHEVPGSGARSNPRGPGEGRGYGDERHGQAPAPGRGRGRDLLPGRRGRRGYDPADDRERPTQDPGTGPQRPPGYAGTGQRGRPGYGEGPGYGPPAPGRPATGDPRERDPYDEPAGRRRRAHPPSPAGPDYGPGGGYDAPPGGARGYPPAPGRRGRAYDTGPRPAGDYDTGPGGRGYDTGPHPRGRDYDTGPGAARSYETGPRPAGDYGTGPRPAGDYGTGPRPAGSYGTGPGGREYGPGPGRRGRDYRDSGTGDYGRGDYATGDYGRGGPGAAGPGGGRDHGASGGRRRGPAGPPPDDSGRGAPSSRAGRRRGGWLGRGSAPEPDERSSPRRPSAPPPRSRDGALSPLPPLPPRGGRRHRPDDGYDPAEGPPSDWGQDRPDEGDPDW
jgi:GT2 family glycosyltransferase